MINLSLSLAKSLSYTTIWVLFVIPSCVLPVDERHIQCTPWFRCGNQTYLYYPFRTADREECGHPDFKVNCSGDFAEFSISSVKFRILEMNHESRIVRLARMDYLNNLCLQYPESAPINQDVLPFYEDTELPTFFYDCPVPRLDVPPSDYIRQLNCEDGIGELRYFVLPPSRSRDRAILDKCKTNFNIPVSRSALTTAERNQSLEAMKEALDQGFKLYFNSDCSRCVESKGACGYNHSFGAFVCYCENEPHRHTCIKKDDRSKNVKLGIGFACAFLGATFLIGFLLCIFIRRRKKLGAQYTSKGLSTTTPYSSNSMSNTPTSSTICFLCFMIRERGTSHHPRHHNLKALVEMKQYSYAEVKKITKSFSHKVGKGGFGTVYGGHLYDGCKVAVKIL